MTTSSRLTPTPMDTIPFYFYFRGASTSRIVEPAPLRVTRTHFSIQRQAFQETRSMRNRARKVDMLKGWPRLVSCYLS